MLQYTIDGFEIYEYQAPDKVRENKFMFFAHANGIPSQTYRTMIEKLSQELNMTVITYDQRGMGKTQTPAKLIKVNKNDWTWDLLKQDHIKLFLKIKEQKNSNSQWILAGHSLGAWISLLAADELNINSLILFDPPMLPYKKAFLWSIVSFLRKHHLHPIGQRVKKNTISFL